MRLLFDMNTSLFIHFSLYDIPRCSEAKMQAVIPRILQCSIVLTLTRSKTIPGIASLSAADGSFAVCALRPEEAGEYRGFFVLSNADIPSRGIVA